GKLNEGSLNDIAGLADDLVALAGELSDDWHVERPDDVRTMAYADAAGEVRVVFVVSDAAKPTTAVVLAGERTKSLRDPLAGETFEVADGRVRIAMAARSVRLLTVTAIG